MDDFSATIPAIQVIAEIKAALNTGLAKHPILTLDKIELELKTLVEKNVGMGVKFKVPLINFEFGADGALTEESIQVLKLTLTPPEPKETKGPELELEVATIEDQLVEGIDAIAEIIEYSTIGEPKLEVGSSSIELNFVFTAEGKISLVASAKGKKVLTHSIKLFLKQQLNVEHQF